MNYGREFIKKYNDYLKKCCDEYPLRFNKKDNSNKTFSRLFTDIDLNIYNELRALVSRENAQDFFNSSDSLLRKHKKDYEKDITITIIENEIQQYFEKNKNQSDFLNFTDFLDGFTQYKAMYDMEEYIRDNKERLEKLYEKSGINNFFKIKIRKNELNFLEDDSKNKKSSEGLIIKTNVDNNNNNNRVPSILLNDDEKLLLLHILFNCSKKPSYDLNEVEFLSILRITKDVHDGKNINERYDTPYKKIKKGLYYYGGDNLVKRKMLNQIVEICDFYKLNVTKEYIRSIYPK
jgi:DNA-binding ferritin-like protein (Dps family)